jgi:hypothetical protein
MVVGLLMVVVVVDSGDGNCGYGGGVGNVGDGDGSDDVGDGGDGGGDVMVVMVVLVMTLLLWLPLGAWILGSPTLQDICPIPATLFLVIVNSTQSLGLFPTADITNYHKLGGLH